MSIRQGKQLTGEDGTINQLNSHPVFGSLLLPHASSLFVPNPVSLLRNPATMYQINRNILPWLLTSV
jgi:hypothetical protein